MNKNVFYLSERRYINSSQRIKKGNIKKVDYWEKIIGKSTFDYLLKCNDKIIHFLNEEDFIVESDIISYELYKFMAESRGRGGGYYLSLIKEKVFFPEFYCKVLEYGNDILKYNLHKVSDCFANKIYDDFSVHLVAELQNICVRTLILKMHSYKEEGRIKGEDTKGEYDFFCNHFLTCRDFYIELFDEFPVLYRCIHERCMQLVTFYTEVIQRFEQDRAQIEKELFHRKKGISKITGIKGDFSDLHNGAKQVLCIELDYGDKIFYKPHTMENEKVFYELLKWLENKTGISQNTYLFISKGTYSWSSIIKYSTCKNKKQVYKYYLRLGVQLFLAYLLGTKDLHYENLIAVGEYPVLIDLEVLLSATQKKDEIIIAQEVYNQLSESVLYTGILPFYYWNKEENGIDGSAMNGAGGQIYPFKMPVIVNGKTSEMRIEYQYLRSKISQNKVILNNQCQESAEYKNAFTKGFIEAYKQALFNKTEIKKWLKRLENLKSRVLVADTQRYTMLLSSSYHPNLLRDGADREIFLHTIWNGRSKRENKIVGVEINSLLKGDIPFFYCRSNCKAILSGSEVIQDNYYIESPIEKIATRLNKLNTFDMQRQVEYIDMAMDLSFDEENKYQNRVYHASKNIVLQKKTLNCEIYSLDSLISRLLRHAIWNSQCTEVSWMTVQISSNKKISWSVRAMNYYLYNGLAGMLLLFHKLHMEKQHNQFSQIYQALKKMLFSYTDKGCMSLENLTSRQTGMYEGESSIAYVYLLIFFQNNEEDYLEYAERHMGIVENLIEEDTNYDLMSGNAGAAYVFIMLYKLTKKKKYLNAAERGFCRIMSVAERQSCGIGWSVEKEVPPMAGMAHGNSGFLIPAIGLWKYTRKEQYDVIAEQILEYENSLYDIDMNNWKDIRMIPGIESVDNIGTVAWCHGAAGILLSRIKCFEMVKDEKWEKCLLEDVFKAYSKVKEFWKRDSFSLCHGCCGNLWILEIAEQVLTKQGIIAQNDKQKKYENCLIKLLPQEKMNPGFMNGYGGIIYFLLHQK